MPVLIDTPRWPAHGRLWSHLVSDSSLDELHAFASSVGLPPRSFEGDHYDVPAEHYDSLVAAGAHPVTGRELVRALQASGLRLPKRKGERVLTSTLTRSAPRAGSEGAWSEGSSGQGSRGWSAGGEPRRLDLLASPLEAPAASTIWAGVLVLGGAELEPAVLMVRAADGWGLPGGALRAGETAAQGASRALAEQTGLRLAASVLRPCGHQRDMPVARARGPVHRPARLEQTDADELDRTDLRDHAARPTRAAPADRIHGRRTTWRTMELARLEPAVLVDPGGATWLPADEASRQITHHPWGPLIDWVVTRVTI